VRRHFGPLDCLHLIGNTRRDMQAASNMHHCSHLGSEPRTYHFEAGAWTFDYVLNDLHGGQGVHIQEMGGVGNVLSIFGYGPV
jgi:uncharacterized protein (DUF1786 family)